MPVESTDKKPILAILGPEGTYTHQAAFERFGNSVQYLPKTSIADTIGALSPSTPLACIPLENSTHGVVVETLDLLRDDTFGKDAFVRDDIVTAIRHCLVARTGTRLEDIQTVSSHEQALGQCSKYLSTHLPGVRLVPSSSTAGAARDLLDLEDTDAAHHAAICSSICVSLYPGLEIVQEGIQDGTENFTRFIILSISTQVPPPALLTFNETRARSAQVPWFGGPRALLRFSFAPQSGQSMSTVLSCFSRPPLQVCRFDRRPSLSALPFHDVYYIEVESTTNDECHLSSEWVRSLETSIIAARKVTGNGHVLLLGKWRL